jgi:hypothetical protein
VGIVGVLRISGVLEYYGEREEGSTVGPVEGKEKGI